MLLGIAAVVATSAWIVARTGAVGSALPNGEIPATDLERSTWREGVRNRARDHLRLESLWAAVVATFAASGRYGRHQTTGHTFCSLGRSCSTSRRSSSMERAGAVSGFLLLALTLSAALVSVATVMQVVRWFERRTTSLTLWMAGLPLLAAMSWLGGLQQPLSPTDALEAITFVAAMQASRRESSSSMRGAQCI